jgi:hypothetical protein
MRLTIASFSVSFSLALLLFTLFLSMAYEPKVKPSWYGTYYSLSDAMEDGWYDRQ